MRFVVSRASGSPCVTGVAARHAPLLFCAGRPSLLRAAADNCLLFSCASLI